MSKPKNILVVGASSGIGASIATRFANEGWNVCVTSRREDSLQEVSREFPPGHHLLEAADYSVEADVERLHKKIASEWGHLDAMVNSVGISFAADAISAPQNEIEAGFHTMVHGACLVSRMAVGLMASGGRIVHITSIHASRAELGGAGYSMAKAAINQYVRVLAMELAPRGILVNSIAPGFINTPMSSAGGENELETPWFRRNYIEGHHLPLRRAGRPEEVAGVAWFLCGRDASYLTGQCLIVDGGLTITF